MSENMGKSFIWFVGVVEDRQDPKYLGRLRVRCLGYHTEDLTVLPTVDLPWAHVMNPITSATVSGLGQTPLGAVEGTWVIGFFQDGADAQMPIIIGTLPGMPSELPTKLEKGSDGEYAGKGFQDYINAVYPKYKEEPDVNRLAVNDKGLSEADQTSWAGGEGWSMEEFAGSSTADTNENNPHPTLTQRRADRDIAVGTAQIDGIFNGVATIPRDLDEGGKVEGSPHTDRPLITGGEWDEPKLYDDENDTFTAVYPNNHVYESESGHIREYDDTKDAERIHERHMSGSGYEIGPDGSKVTRVKKDNYTIISEDDYCHIQGTGRTTIDEGLRVRVNANGESGNNYNIEVGAGSNVNVEVNKGNINLTTLSPDVGDININASRDLNMQVNRNVNIGVLGKVDIEVMGDWTESTKNKTESTETHIMNAKLQDINADSEIDADAPTVSITGSSRVDVDGGRIDLN